MLHRVTLTLPVLREAIRVRDVTIFDLRSRTSARFPELTWAVHMLSDAVTTLTGIDPSEEIDHALAYARRTGFENFWYGLAWVADVLEDALTDTLKESHHGTDDAHH